MKKRSTLFVIFSAVSVLILSLFLVACGGNDNNGDTGGTNDTNETANTDDLGEGQTSDTAPTVASDDPIAALVPPHIATMINRSMPSADPSELIDGGILHYAVVATTPFAGVLHPLWSTDATDGNDIGPIFLGSLMTLDDDFLLDPEGLGAVRTFEISEDGLTITMFLHDNVYWHNGDQLVARDWEFAYEVLAHPDTTSTRFGQQNSDRIVGINEFRAGDVDYISGIEVIDDLTISFTFEEIVPILNTVFTFPLPYNVFRNIPVDEMEDSIYVRTPAALGFGAFEIEVIVPGESVTFSRNENFWRGRPLLDGIELRLVHPDLVGEELQAGNIDIATNFAEANFPYFEHLTNTTFLKSPGWAYNVITFRMGYFDTEAGRAALDPDAPMANADLRRAMWMAIDTEMISDVFFNGLRWEGSTIIPPIHSGFHNPNVQRPPYDMEAANALLDAAGFDWDSNNEWRTNEDGSRLELTLVVATGDITAQAIQQYHLTQWRELGIYMHLREYEFTVFGNLFTTETDDTDWDVQLNAWSSGSNPSPSGFFAAEQGFNRSRYTSARTDELLARIDSPQASLDPQGYRVDAMWEFQEYVVEVGAVVPTQFRFSFIPINNRVRNFEIVASAAPRFGCWHLVGLTHDETIPH